MASADRCPWFPGAATNVTSKPELAGSVGYYAVVIPERWEPEAGSFVRRSSIARAPQP